MDADGMDHGGVDRPADGASTRNSTNQTGALARYCASLAVLATGCASIPTPPAIEEEGKSLWQRIETDHFVVESNLADDRKVIRIAAEFEILWHAFAAVPVLGMQPPSEKPIVIVLRDEAEYQYLFGVGTAGMCVPKTALGPLIVLPPNSGAFQAVVIKHELAHFIASRWLPTSVKWLHEGLAQVMETADYDVMNGQILFGSPSDKLTDSSFYSMPANRFMQPWPEVMSGVDAYKFYGRSWLLVHYLIDSELQAFLNMLVRIGNGADWETAWDREIMMRRGEIDAALDRYHHKGRYGLWVAKAQPPDVNAFVKSDVPAADSLALRAVLHAHSSTLERDQAQNREAADRDLRSASELAPTSDRVRKVSESVKSASNG